MKNIITSAIICIILLGCKKDIVQTEQTIPVPFYFQLLTGENETPLDITQNNLKIWYFINDSKVFVDNIKPIKMKSGSYEYGIMSQGMSMISAFKNIKTFYVQVNDQEVNTIYLDIRELEETNEDKDRFPVISVKFNNEEIKLSNEYLPSLWLFKKKLKQE